MKPMIGNTTTSRTMAVNTVGHVGMVYLPFSITVNKISFYVDAVGTSGTMKLAIFSEDGQTQHISVTTASISGAGNVITSVGSVALTPGLYLVVLIPVDTASIDVRCWAEDYLHDVASEPVYSGTYTVTASTMPATITPGSISAANREFPLVRLDA